MSIFHSECILVRDILGEYEYCCSGSNPNPTDNDTIGCPRNHLPKRKL
jgi:hypothetical protein